ncbi:MAG TPA: helix-turn-helix domain-containing protein [Rhizomicrobium sp.]|jgi:AcrR family transcriptional regulator
MAKSRKPVPRDPEETRARLLAAAETLFNSKGFEGTDTNRIARAAGYAPQTFYRHFPDKTAIFLAVYDNWWRAEAAAVALALAHPNRAQTPRAAARIGLDFHARWRIFRRSLRHLSLTEPAIRKARAAARKAQIAKWKKAGAQKSTAELAAALLCAERLCDAAAEGEFTDLGISPAITLNLVTDAMEALIARS